jgi:hypothetical protein
MANNNTPFGLKPVRYVSGAPYNGAADVMVHDSGDGTALYIGDCVLITGASSVINGVTYPNVIRAATTDVVSGVIVGVLPDVATSLPYCVASTTRRLLVATDPNLLFECQEIGTGTALTADDIGLNVSLSVVSGSTTTGLSGSVLNNATEATSNALLLKIVGLVNRADNAVGAYAKWLVRINRHRFVDQLAGV